MNTTTLFLDNPAVVVTVSFVMLTPDDNVAVCADIRQPRDHIVTRPGDSSPLLTPHSGPGDPSLKKTNRCS